MKGPILAGKDSSFYSRTFDLFSLHTYLCALLVHTKGDSRAGKTAPLVLFSDNAISLDLRSLWDSFSVEFMHISFVCSLFLQIYRPGDNGRTACRAGLWKKKLKKNIGKFCIALLSHTHDIYGHDHSSRQKTDYGTNIMSANMKRR